VIVSKKKPIEELMAMLDGVKKVALVGCKSCAASCAVGGEKECNDMKAYLENNGIEVVAIALPDESCQKLLVKKEVKAFRDSGAEAVISLACGNGCQTVAQNVSIPVYPANNTVFMGQTERVGIFNEMCRMCGDCVLGSTGAICPISKCAKSLVNGPCGGQKNGKCEVNPENDCAWILIYNKLKELGQIEKITKTSDDKGYAEQSWPRKVNTKEDK
jgi:hypothetical protein